MARPEPTARSAPPGPLVGPTTEKAQPTNDARDHSSAPSRRRFAFLSLAAIGVVYGDIGTSPLYAVRESFSGHFGVAPTAPHVLGVVSLIVWSLILIVCVKYLYIVLAADNEGEGGILALTALAMPDDPEPGSTRLSRRARSLLLVPIGLFGAALLFGDGMLTPAISVLGAMEGLSVTSPSLAPFVLPLAVAVIAGLFLVQRQGTSGVGLLFGPVSLAWFVTIAALGVIGIARDPAVLAGLNPSYAIALLAEDAGSGLFVLGAIFLVVTGAEALYADLGHFGRGPIRLSWFAVVFPALLLNYLGQGALVLADPGAAASPFFLLAPEGFGLPLVILSTAAAIIASQAVISGVFSLAHQAVQLGYWPRTLVRHTSATEFGQVYVPRVNGALMVGSIAVVLAFQSSSGLAAAYGIAIATTMVATTLLLFYVLPQRLGWRRLATWAVLAFFLTIELAFLRANLEKVIEGGWFPLLVAGVVFTLAVVWHHGRDFLNRRLTHGLLRLEELIEDLPRLGPARVPGTAVYLTRSLTGVPPALSMNIRHNHVLHERVVLLAVKTENTPHVRLVHRASVDRVGDGFWKAALRFGFMDEPDVLAALPSLEAHGIPLRLDQTSFYLGRERIITAGQRASIRAWVAIFSFLSRNSQRATVFFNLPPDRVVEVGSQLEI